MRSLGDDCFEVPSANSVDAQCLAMALRAGGAFLDVVAGLASVAVRYDAAKLSRQQAVALLQDALSADTEIDPGEHAELRIDVFYGGADGPDLLSVCEQLKLSSDEFIARHTTASHGVELLGFTPGFAYLTDMGAAYSVPRLVTPRPRVAAGSIGFAGGRSGIYALPGPGGWPLIGRTQQQLFDRNADEPFVVRPGMRIRFERVQ